jgi:MoaA/NifB/PqqE/SkfB family radical SAM enzyme
MMGNWATKWAHPAYHHLTDHYGRVASLFPGMSPLVLRLRVTANCNLRCTFCYQGEWHRKDSADPLSLPEWETILDKLPRWTLIDITGGEPFLAPGFPALLELILSKGFKTSLITNGSLCTERDLETIVRGRLAYFMVSIDGLEDYHNRIRGNRRSFEKLQKALRAIAELKRKHRSSYPVTCVKTTLTEDNYGELVRLHEHVFEDLGVENHSLNLLFQNPARGGARISDELDESCFTGNQAVYPKAAIPLILAEIGKLHAVARAKGRQIRFKPEIRPGMLRSYLENPAAFGVRSCSKLRSVLTLYYDGRTTPCDLGVGVGNIRDFGYDPRRLLAGEKMGRVARTLAGRGEYSAACDGCCLMPHSPRPGLAGAAP